MNIFRDIFWLAIILCELGVHVYDLQASLPGYCGGWFETGCLLPFPSSRGMISRSRCRSPGCGSSLPTSTCSHSSSSAVGACWAPWGPYFPAGTPADDGPPPDSSRDRIHRRPASPYCTLEPRCVPHQPTRWRKRRQTRGTLTNTNCTLVALLSGLPDSTIVSAIVTRRENTCYMQDLRFSRRWLWRMSSSGI
jgi:hypothetical protein